MRFHRLLFVPAVTVAIYACDHAAEVPAGYDDVVYVGNVTDESLIALIGALEQGPPASSPDRAPTLDTPADGATIKAGSVSAFSWHFGSTASLHERSIDWMFNQRSALRPTREALSSRFISPLRELLGPIRSAQAHGEPFSGAATYLVFSTDSNPKLLRVLTSQTSYMPDQAASDKLASADGKPITLTLTAAEFESNRILQDGGPFAGSSITFTVVP